MNKIIKEEFEKKYSNIEPKAMKETFLEVFEAGFYIGRKYNEKTSDEDKLFEKKYQIAKIKKPNLRSGEDWGVIQIYESENE